MEATGCDGDSSMGDGEFGSGSGNVCASGEEGSESESESGT